MYLPKILLNSCSWWCCRSENNTPKIQHFYQAEQFNLSKFKGLKSILAPLTPSLGETLWNPPICVKSRLQKESQILSIPSKIPPEINHTWTDFHSQIISIPWAHSDSTESLSRTIIPPIIIQPSKLSTFPISPLLKRGK
jgi:hypothetical protein